MLRALKRLIRRGGRIAYTTISIAPDLDAAARRRARQSGPRAVSSRAGQRRLLESAGFVDIDELDVSAAFADTARAWIEGRAAHGEALAALEAPGAFDERLMDSRAMLAAVEDGLLRRGILSAVRP